MSQQRPAIYLDHTATTPLDSRVLAAMEPYFAATYGNASSVHRFGREAKQALEGARGTIASLLGAAPAELFFTSGGTEADNLALRGLPAKAGGREETITTTAEHHAVLETAEDLRNQGAKVRIVPVDGTGVVDPDALRPLLGQSTLLVSIMHGNNEVGSISPLPTIAEMVHAAGGYLHSDAVQTAGKVPVDVNRLGVDMLSLSAHKMYGPKGVGLLYVRRTCPLHPVVSGGGQERGLRPGTENVAGAVGMAEAFRLAVGEMEHESARLAGLRDALEQELTGRFSSLMVNGDRANRLPHILNVSFDSAVFPLEGEMLVVNMDLEGVACSAGSACTSGSVQPSHVLMAMGRDEKTARAALRFSFGRSNTIEDVGRVVDALERTIGRMSA